MRLVNFILIVICLNSCNNKDKKHNINSNSDISNTKVDSLKLKNTINSDSYYTGKGFLFVDITTIYKNNKKLSIEKKRGVEFVNFKGKNVIINNNSYELIKEEVDYYKQIDVISYDPEYGLFIIKCLGLNEEGFYKVEVNNDIMFINKNKYQDVLNHKSPEKYVLESKPYLYNNDDTTLREQPNDSSKVIENYKDHLYISIEIKGDWLKVKNDDKCFIKMPPQDEIVGWVRWRKNGEIIIDVRHLC
jgi:hypothetical protein